MTTAPSPWPATRDRVGQAVLAGAAGIVLAAMVHDAGHAADVATWTADAVALSLLAAAGLAHWQARRGRPGRWPALVALAVPVTVLLFAV